MDRSRIVVITDPDTAEGFVLTGVEVRPFANPREAREEVGMVLKDDAVEIVVVNDIFLEGIEARVEEHMQSSRPPVLISLPIGKTKGRLSSDVVESILSRADWLSAAREEPAEAFGIPHRISHHDLEARTCRTCGHEMEPGMRICDRCGSVQRSSRTKEAKPAPSKVSHCKICGAEIRGTKALCSKCLATEATRHATEGKPGYFGRVVTSIVCILAFAALVAGIVGLALSWAPAVWIPLVAAGGVSLVVAGLLLAWYMRARARRRKEVPLGGT